MPASAPAIQLPAGRYDLTRDGTERPPAPSSTTWTCRGNVTIVGRRDRLDVEHRPQRGPRLVDPHRLFDVSDATPTASLYAGHHYRHMSTCHSATRASVRVNQAEVWSSSTVRSWSHWQYRRVGGWRSRSSGATSRFVRSVYYRTTSRNGVGHVAQCGARLATAACTIGESIFPRLQHGSQLGISDNAEGQRGHGYVTKTNLGKNLSTIRRADLQS